MYEWNKEPATATRCSDCSITYPANVTTCMVCGGWCWSLKQTPPDEDWQEQVARLKGERVRDQGDSPYPHPDNAQAQRYVHAGEHFFKHEDLTKAGYLYLEAGTIIFVNQEFYELLGYHRPEECWWVKLIETEGAFEDATPEAIIGASE